MARAESDDVASAFRAALDVHWFFEPLPFAIANAVHREPRSHSFRGDQDHDYNQDPEFCSVFAPFLDVGVGETSAAASRSCRIRAGRGLPL